MHNETAKKSTAKSDDDDVGPNEEEDDLVDVYADNVSASFGSDSDIDAESIAGEVASIKSSNDADIFSIDDDDDDDDDDDEPATMINDGVEHVGESLFGKCSTAELDRKSKIMIEKSHDSLSSDNKSSMTSQSQRKNKMTDNDTTSQTKKKTKSDRSVNNVANGVNVMNDGIDPSNFLTPKKNLFPDSTGNESGNAVANQIELLQQMINELKEAESTKAKVSDAAGKLTNDIGGNVSAPVATVPSVVSGDVSATPIISDFSTVKLQPYQSPSSKNQLSGTVLTLEVSYAFTNKKSGEITYVLILHGGTETWIIKPEVLNESARQLLSAPLGGQIASVFTSFITTFYRAVACGLNNLHRRTLPYNQTPDRPAYPSTKLMTVLSNPSTGFSLQTRVTYFQNQLRAMMTKSDIPAQILNEHMKSEIPILHTKFMAGSYRRDGKKNTPYNDESELKEYFKEALQRTFKNEFRIVYDITLDKYLPDSGIKNFLLSLGYNGFDEVNEEERKRIYFSGNFPIWEKIQQEPLN